MVMLQDRIDHSPRGLDRIFPGKKRAIAPHGIA
jgi:hypothetical protein